MLDEFALARFAGNDGLTFEGDVAVVESEFGLPIIFVVAVADEAVFRKDGPNIAIELDFIRCTRHGENAERRQQRQKRKLAVSGTHIQGKIKTRLQARIFVWTLVMNAMNDTVVAINLTN